MIKPWEDIINTSIIGTDKKQINKQLLSDELALILEQAEQCSNEKEEQFLAAASVIYNYRRGGILPIIDTTSSIPICEEEQKKQCSSAALASLQATLGEENYSLLFYWLLQCERKEQIVTPEYIPVLLEIATKNKELQSIICECLGNRGMWMRQFNSQWDFSQYNSYKEVFEHGKLDERKNALIQWRVNSAQEAREALIGVWQQEQVATKAELLTALEINLSQEDESFLKETWKEKSQKVKEVTLKLLKQIPDSFIINEVWEFVRPLISYKKTSTMLGLLSKEIVEINLSFEIPEQFKSYGISHLDANKIYSEKEFTLDQLISFIPPVLWEKHFNMKPAQILELFDKKEESKKFISGLAMGVNTFKNIEWGIILYKKHNKLCHSVIFGFDKGLQEDVALATLHENSKRIYDILPDKENEWSLKFVTALLEKTSQEPYTYNKNYYKNIIHHFPVSILEKLGQIQVADPVKKNYWDNIAEEIIKQLAIKYQIIQSF